MISVIEDLVKQQQFVLYFVHYSVEILHSKSDTAVNYEDNYNLDKKRNNNGDPVHENNSIRYRSFFAVKVTTAR